ncbi:MAG: hypothetical protein KDD29_07595, partial [Flavobacteriales bacterium]|nr:hypothetical protein [Flavobacteriales bacterium]
LHTRIIDLRNNYVAHSGINESEKAHVFGIRSNTNNRYLLIKGITSSAIDDPIEDFENTIKLFEFTLNYVEKKLDILQGSLNRKYYSW